MSANLHYRSHTALHESCYFAGRTGKYELCTEIRITFLGYHTRSFLLILTMLWYKHGTMAKGRPEFPQICINGPIPLCMNPGSLLARTGKYEFCTEIRITFLGSPYP